MWEQEFCFKGSWMRKGWNWWIQTPLHPKRNEVQLGQQPHNGYMLKVKGAVPKFHQNFCSKHFQKGWLKLNFTNLILSDFFFFKEKKEQNKSLENDSNKEGVYFGETPIIQMEKPKGEREGKIFFLNLGQTIKILGKCKSKNFGRECLSGV